MTPRLRPEQHPRSCARAGSGRHRATSASAARLRAIVAHAHAHAPQVRRTLDAAGVVPGEVRDPGGSRPDCPSPARTRCPRSRPRSRRSAACWGSRSSAWRASSCRRARSSIRRGTWRTSGASATGWQRQGSGRGEIVQNAASYHLTPLGFMLDCGRAEPRMRRHPGGRGTDGAAGEGGRDGGCDRVPRHAELPAHAPHQGARAGDAARHRGRLRGGGDAARVAARRAGGRVRGAGRCRVTARPTWGASPTSARRRAAGTSTLSASWRSSISRPVATRCPGQPGEVVVTVFDQAYPLLRFATGDIAALAPEASVRVRPDGPQDRRAAGAHRRRGEGEGHVRAGGPRSPR